MEVWVEQEDLDYEAAAIDLLRATAGLAYNVRVYGHPVANLEVTMADMIANAVAALTHADDAPDQWELERDYEAIVGCYF